MSYTGSVTRGTTVGAAAYINRRDDPIGFVALPLSADPYTAQNPPPGWSEYLGASQLPSPLAEQLPALLLAQMAQFNVFFPRTAFTHTNLGPVQQTGLELWLDQRIGRSASAWVNYSWQDEPEILAAENPYPTEELSLPPTHRLNAGVSWNGSRFLGNGSLSTATEAFWADVLTPEFHGYSDGYTLVNGSFGVKWSGGAVTTLIKVTNLFNQSIQQHIFGDILRRTVVGEVRFSM